MRQSIESQFNLVNLKQTKHSSQKNIFCLRAHCLEPKNKPLTQSTELISSLLMPKTAKASQKLPSLSNLIKAHRLQDKATNKCFNKSYEKMTRELKLCVESMKSVQLQESILSNKLQKKRQSRNISQFPVKPQIIKMKVNYINSILDTVYPNVLVSKIKFQSTFNVKKGKTEEKCSRSRSKSNNKALCHQFFPTELYKRSFSFKSALSLNPNLLLRQKGKQRKIILNKRVLLKKVHSYNYL